MISFRGLLKYFAVAACVLCSVKTVSAASDSGFKNRTTVLLAGDSIMELATNPSVDGFISLLAGRYSRSADMIVRALSGYNTRYNRAHLLAWKCSSHSTVCPSYFQMVPQVRDARHRRRDHEG